MTAAVEPLTSVMRSLPGQANGYLTWRLQMNRKIDLTVHPPRILRKTYGIGMRPSTSDGS